MAKEITLPPPKPDPRKELFLKLERAPHEHAEALLDAYDLLQLLRDKGILEIAKGLVGSGEKVLGVVAETMEADGTTIAFRNLTIILKILGALNPAVLEDVEKTLIRNINEQRDRKPPGVFKIFRRFSSHDSRRFLTMLASIAESMGRTLLIADSQGRSRKKTMRHNA